MVGPDARTEQELERFAAQVRTAIGNDLVCLAIYGSAAGEDWVPGRSDVNLVVVVTRLSFPVLDALVPVVGGRPRTIALPLVVDEEYLDRARDTFPMEVSDLARQHRMLAGRDVLAGLTVEPDALRRQCEQEGRGKLLRLRALYLETACDPAALERLMVESLKTFLVLLRHLLELRGTHPDSHYADVVQPAEAVLGPLPTMRRLLDHRTGTAPLALGELRREFGRYLDEVERIVAALDLLDA